MCTLCDRLQSCQSPSPSSDLHHHCTTCSGPLTHTSNRLLPCPTCLLVALLVQNSTTHWWPRYITTSTSTITSTQSP
jgi:hypothetical protein